MPLAKDKLLALYRKMLLVRTMEETHGKLLKEGKLQLMGHFGTGQEAVAIGITGPLKQEDILFGTHRGVGEFIGKGMDPKDIDISLSDGMLTIRGEKKQEREEKETDYHLVERSYGAFTRSIHLPKEVQRDKISASYKNGILKITLPKSEEAKKKEIKIRVD